MEITLITIALAILGYALVSNKLDNTPITMPMLFIGLGFILASTGSMSELGDKDLFHFIAEATLALVLFADASRLSLHILNERRIVTVRMLLLGLPLMVLIGTGIGALLLPGWPLLEVALLAALLAPTDAALGQAVVTNKAIPEDIRASLNAESGLNDGLALPLILFLACAAVGGEHELQQSSWLVFAVQQIGMGILAGGVSGALGGAGLRWATDTDCISAPLSGVAILALAGLVFFSAEWLGGNSFIAMFVAGLAFGKYAGEHAEFAKEFVETDGQILTILSFLFVGAILLPEALEHINLILIVLILISLLIARPLAISLSLLGTGADRSTTLFLGWFGPRGLATALFAVFALSEFDKLTKGPVILSVCAVAVVCSALLHGVSAHYAEGIFGFSSDPKHTDD